MTTPPVLGLPAPLAALAAERCLVMGVLNVTPDSFSDGGRYVDLDDAVRHGVALVASGADLVDVGGESTRPGAIRVDADVEAARVVPVVRELAAAGVAVSVDTTRAAVAEAALQAGAVLVNDVSGGLADPAMGRFVAAARVPYVAMHWRGPSHEMDRLAEYDDVVADVRTELARALDQLVAAGVDPEQVVLDPGLGFAKTPEHNWALIAGLADLATLGRPLLVGASRKRFLGALLAGADGTPRPVDERDAAGDAVAALAAAAGAWGVRVHDVRGSADAVRVVAAAQAAQREHAEAAAGGRHEAAPEEPGATPASAVTDARGSGEPPAGPASGHPGGRPRLGLGFPTGALRLRLPHLRPHDDPADPDAGAARPDTGEPQPRSASRSGGPVSDNHDTAARPGRRPGGVGEPAPAASGAKPRGTDRVSLRGLRVTGYHGVFDFEREAGQDFVIDADLAVRTEPAARWDDLTQTVDYSTLAQRLAEVVAGEPCNLIETLAARLAAAALQDTGVEAVTITVHKPQAPIDGLTFEDVTVSVTRDRSSVRLGVLSLGSNLGDRLAHLQAGVDALAATPGVVVRKVSPVYETDPVGVPGEQPQYLNAAVLVETALNPRDLLGVARRVENLRGRERPERYAARTLDVDLIALGDEESDDPNLTLPHPRAFERGFVLAPWLAVQPEAELPGYGRVAVQLARVGSEGLERRDDLPLHLPGA